MNMELECGAGRDVMYFNSSFILKSYDKIQANEFIKQTWMMIRQRISGNISTTKN